MLKGAFKSLYSRWGIAGVISASIHAVFLIILSAYAISNPEAIKQVYVQIISIDQKLPDPKPKLRFRPTRISTETVSSSPSYSEFLPKLESAPRSNSLMGGTNLIGVKSDVVLPYGEGLLRSPSEVSKVDSLSSGAVYEMKRSSRIEPKVAEVAKAPLFPSVPSKAEHIAPKLSIEFKDPTATGLEIPRPSAEIERVEPPKWIKKVTPEYPEAARRAGIEGSVVLEAEVKEDGSLGEIKVVESLGYGCDEAAKSALLASKLAPAKKNGEPIFMRTLIPYKFQLEKEKSR